MAQCPGVMTRAYHTSLLAREQCIDTVLLGVMECHTQRTMHVRSGSSSQHEQRRPQGTVRRQEPGSVVGVLCQGEEPLAQGAGCHD